MKVQPQVNKILQVLKEYLPVGSNFIVACSGGADSLALADAAALLKDQMQYKIYVCHVEHGLRGEEALADAKLVKDFCLKKKLPYKCIHVQTNLLAKEQKLSLEDAARQLRYDALYRYAKDCKAEIIVTAHHQDDQAETLLMQLLRGSGLDGLKAMSLQQGKLLRPFLEVTRNDLENYCLTRGLQYCVDSTNEDTNFTRNRIRKTLIPLLISDFNPQIKKSLVQTAALLKKDAEALNELAEKAFVECVQINTQQIVCNVKLLQIWPQAVQTRVLRQAWQVGAAKGILGYRHTQQLVTLISNKVSGKKIALPGAVEALYQYETIIFRKKKPLAKATDTYCVNIEVQKLQQEKEEQITLCDGSVLLLQYLHDCPKITNPQKQALYPWLFTQKQILSVRTRLAGDVFFPKGAPGSKKLKDFFIDQKWSQEQRQNQLLVACEQQILWLIGVRQADWKPTVSKQGWLLIEIKTKKG